MISFRPMTKDEYPAYLEYFVNDYACEIEANYGESLQDSLARAKQEISEMLPEGVNTHGQVLMCIIFQLDKAQSHVGYLWYKPDSTKRTAFIYDFHIFNSNQGLGLGKQSLRAFDEYLQDKGFKEIRLRVAGDNARARHVYETSGFGVTGVNMSKSITGRDIGTR
ncbi:MULTISPECIES: GNAT family N-acetyltransferase [Enterobacter]|jgi:ribosomal protein S18 acetylase RimI-like enzyme|uniref:GNAT family N-acetyltransferase n=1 Tax=Enterobacter TaxID=547 RepID=UPI0003D8BB6C|nr:MULTISPECIES: GNAT family N-acetyltransferase [Enterobacter]AHE73273.1 acetyltransferase [Enterobacter ludwigii]ELK6309209.1 N-acetyltransferase [Enterobacter ludwigii]ELK6312630.1 N-acetyltransferase [Enterobacter ludwigii]MBG0575915.1 N-acetyltransferase [Enterobacter ludwigii]MCE1609173.1 GNAT family N-acetyltransferase [Enterobacter ludwigii]